MKNATLSLFKKDGTPHPGRVFFAVLAMAAIGLLRVSLHIALNVRLDSKWYSWDPDLLYVMAFYPPFLCFFYWMILEKILVPVMGLKKLTLDQSRNVFVFFFWIQGVHLIIPFFEALQMSQGLSVRFETLLNDQYMFGGFSLNPFAQMPAWYWLPIYFTPLILLFTRVTTLGIDIAWLTVGCLLYPTLRNHTQWSRVQILLAINFLFQFIYWPIYKYYFVFDQAVTWLLGIKSPHHYGYGSFFALGLLFSLIVFLVHFGKTSPKKKKH